MEMGSYRLQCQQIAGAPRLLAGSCDTELRASLGGAVQVATARSFGKAL